MEPITKRGRRSRNVVGLQTCCVQPTEVSRKCGVKRMFAICLSEWAVKRSLCPSAVMIGRGLSKPSPISEKAPGGNKPCRMCIASLPVAI
jgi:hypothetical protein